MDVRIDDNTADNSPSGLHANVGDFRTDAGQSKQCRIGGRNIAGIIVGEDASGFQNVFGFVLWSK